MSCSLFIRLAALILGFVALRGCPGPINVPPPFIPADPIPVEDYFPLAVGNKWEWDLALSDTPGAEVLVPLSLSVTDLTVSGDFQVWHVTLDAPWYIRVFFRWIIGSRGSGYAVRVEDAYYFSSSSSGIGALPDTTGWTLLPLETDLQPRIVESTWNGGYLQIRYDAGTLEDRIPSDARRDLIADGFEALDDVISTSTSDDGLEWRESRLIFGRGAGVVFGATNWGYVYLRRATLQLPGGEEGLAAAEN